MGPVTPVAYVPDTGTAWTGNYVSHAGVAPMLLQGGPEPYLTSLEKMRDVLPQLRTVVRGHGPMGDARSAIDWLIHYLERLRDEVNSAFGAGKTLDETMAAVSDPWAEGLDRLLADAMAVYAPTAPHAADEMLILCRNLHRLNVLATYRLHETAS